MADPVVNQNRGNFAVTHQAQANSLDAMIEVKPPRNFLCEIIWVSMLNPGLVEKREWPSCLPQQALKDF